MQGTTITENGGSTEIRKIVSYLITRRLWILHWFIFRGGVVFGLWKLIHGICSSEVCWPCNDRTYWSLVADIYRCFIEENCIKTSLRFHRVDGTWWSLYIIHHMSRIHFIYPRYTLHQCISNVFMHFPSIKQRYTGCFRRKNKYFRRW